MKLRTRIALLLAASIAITIAAAAVAVQETRTMQRIAATAERAQRTQLEARALLGLTYEFALHRQPRAAQQWRLRYDALARELKAIEAERAATRAPDLIGEVAILPGLFDRLEQSRGDGPHAAVAARRTELLTDNLIANTQTILDSTYLWAVSLAAQRTRSERRLAATAVSTPLVGALSLGLLGVTLTRRVTWPLQRLQQLMTEVTDGDLAVRSGSLARDEIGDLARSFDAMTGALQRALADRLASEQQMRMIADNLPARVARFDEDQRFLYANQATCRQYGVAAESQLLARHLREVQPEALYRTLEPRIAATLRGEPQSFVVTEVSDPGGPRWSGVALVPDRAADGSIHGWYAMIQDITESTLDRQRIESALAEKDVLLREVHHRVKNNMQVISSLLSLQASRTDNPQLQSMLADSRDRIRSMALIHEKLYQSGVLSAIDFGDYLRTLVPLIASAQPHAAVTAHVDAAAVLLDIDRAIPAGLIVNELVSNSFKHAFPAGRAGRIDVVLAVVAGDRVRLSVSDDGVGTPAPDAQTGASLGLRLVRLLAGQFDAELHFGGAPGSSCTLEFAARPPAQEGIRDG